MELFEIKILDKKSSFCSNYLHVARRQPNIAQNLWVFAEDPYGLWVIADLWVMGRNFPQTNLVDKIFYGVSGVMGFERYGLRGV